MLDQVRHPPHGPARIAVGNEHRDGRLLQKQRSGTGPVALGMECAARRIGVEGACVEIPEIEADQRAVHVAGEPGGDLRQQVVHPGVDECNPNTGAFNLAGPPGGHRRIQRLDLYRPFQAAFEELDCAPHPVCVVRQPPARHHVASAIGHREEYRAASGRGRLGVARDDPTQDALGLDAVDSNARTVAKHQRVTSARCTVADAQRRSRKLHRPAQREGERGRRRIIGAAHRGDHCADPLQDRHRVRIRSPACRRRPGILRRGHRKTGSEQYRHDQSTSPGEKCNRPHGWSASHRQWSNCVEEGGG